MTIRRKLRAAGIFCQVHYIPLHTQPDFVATGLSSGSFPGADAYYASCISLPMFPAMTDAYDAALREAARGVVAGGPCPDTGSFYRLRSAGIIAGASPAAARPRCRLYAAYLARHLA